MASGKIHGARKNGGRPEVQEQRGSRKKGLNATAKGGGEAINNRVDKEEHTRVYEKSPWKERPGIR